MNWKLPELSSVSSLLADAVDPIREEDADAGHAELREQALHIYLA